MKYFFEIAAKEKYQDAFFKWLFMNYNCEDKNVADCSCRLISYLLNNMISADEIKDVRFDNIPGNSKLDIIIIVNHLYCICIEDKVEANLKNNLEKYSGDIDAYFKDYKIYKYVIKLDDRLTKEEREKCKKNNFVIITAKDLDEILAIGKTNYLISDFYSTRLNDDFKVKHKYEFARIFESDINIQKMKKEFNLEYDKEAKIIKAIINNKFRFHLHISTWGKGYEVSVFSINENALLDFNLVKNSLYFRKRCTNKQLLCTNKKDFLEI